jgi:hypothetical protein
MWFGIFLHDEWRAGGNTTRHNNTKDKLLPRNWAARQRRQINRQQFNLGESSACQKLDEPAGELNFLLALIKSVTPPFFLFQQRKIAPTTEGLIHSAS